MSRMRVSPCVLWFAAIGTIVVLGWVDWRTGYELNFFVFYFVPVAAAAWVLGFGASLVCAMASALVWYGADLLSEHAYSSPLYAVWNTMIRLTSFLVVAWSMSSIRSLVAAEREKTQELRRYISEIKTLEGFLPICASCKKIRDDRGDWQRLEAYIGERSNAQFSHSYCPECARKAMEEAGLTERRGEQSGPQGHPPGG